jgi:hypothetical protein
MYISAMIEGMRSECEIYSSLSLLYKIGCLSRSDPLIPHITLALSSEPRNIARTVSTEEQHRRRWYLVIGKSFQREQQAVSEAPGALGRGAA